jgi:ATP-binding cassette subfamily G (WHITE) protein 2 (SNQ2)
LTDVRPLFLVFPFLQPTSGLDGQSSFNILRFLRKLADAGQSMLVTIHQPSALLFEQFDRLLLLARGGREFCLSLFRLRRVLNADVV